MNKANNRGETPFMIAGQKGHLDVITVLRAKHLEVSQVKTNGSSSLDDQVKEGPAVEQYREYRDNCQKIRDASVSVSDSSTKRP